MLHFVLIGAGCFDIRGSEILFLLQGDRSRGHEFGYPPCLWLLHGAEKGPGFCFLG